MKDKHRFIAAIALLFLSSPVWASRKTCEQFLSSYAVIRDAANGRALVSTLEDSAELYEEPDASEIPYLWSNHLSSRIQNRGLGPDQLRQFSSVNRLEAGLFFACRRMFENFPSGIDFHALVFRNDGFRKVRVYLYAGPASFFDNEAEILRIINGMLSDDWKLLFLLKGHSIGTDGIVHDLQFPTALERHAIARWWKDFGLTSVRLVNGVHALTVDEKDILAFDSK